MHRAEARAEAQILGTAQPELNAPATAVVSGQLLRGGIGTAGCQAPGLLDVLLLNADHDRHRIALGGDRGAAGFTGRGGDGNVAKDGNDADLDPWGQQFSKPHQHAMLASCRRRSLGFYAPLARSFERTER
jgi:hypothetical protein